MDTDILISYNSTYCNSSSFDFFQAVKKKKKPILSLCAIQKQAMGPTWPVGCSLLTPALPAAVPPNSSPLNQSSFIPKTTWVSIFPPALSPLSCSASKSEVQELRRLRFTQPASPPCPGGWRPWDSCPILSGAKSP